MDVSLVNSFLVANDVGLQMSRKQFIEQNALSLVGGHAAKDPAPTAKRAQIDPKNPPLSRVVGQPWPVSASKGRCMECYAPGRMTKKCGVHVHVDCYKKWYQKKV